MQYGGVQCCTAVYSAVQGLIVLYRGVQCCILLYRVNSAV